MKISKESLLKALKPITFGVNGIYLLEALTKIDTDDFTIAFTDGNSSCLIEESKPDAVKHIIMPMRV